VIIINVNIECIKIKDHPIIIEVYRTLSDDKITPLDSPMEIEIYKVSNNDKIIGTLVSTTTIPGNSFDFKDVYNKINDAINIIAGIIMVCTNKVKIRITANWADHIASHLIAKLKNQKMIYKIIEMVELL